MLLSQFSKFDLKEAINTLMLDEEFNFKTKICNVDSFLFDM